MATYDVAIKKRNDANTSWDTIYPYTRADNVIYSDNSTSTDVKEKIDSHVGNTSIHITQAERNTWNAKSTFSGDYNDLINKPNVSLQGHKHQYSEIEGKPLTFPPSEHTHNWSSITGKPTTFPPSAHTHSYNDLTNKPSIPSRTSHLTNDSGFITVNDIPEQNPSTHTSNTQPTNNAETWYKVIG